MELVIFIFLIFLFFIGISINNYRSHTRNFNLPDKNTKGLNTANLEKSESSLPKKTDTNLNSTQPIHHMPITNLNREVKQAIGIPLNGQIILYVSINGMQVNMGYLTVGRASYFMGKPNRVGNTFLHYFNEQLIRVGDTHLSYFDGKLIKIANTQISYFDGRLVRVGDIHISYFDGRPIRVGDIHISYFDGKLLRVGNIHISYFCGKVYQIDGKFYHNGNSDLHCVYNDSLISILNVEDEANPKSLYLISEE